MPCGRSGELEVAVLFGLFLLERFHFLLLDQLIFSLSCRLGRRSLVAVSEVPPSSLTTEVLAVNTKWILMLLPYNPWDNYHMIFGTITI